MEKDIGNPGQAETDIEKIPKEELADGKNIEFDYSIPLEKRGQKLKEQLKNLYCFRVGDVAVKLEFTEDGPGFQELFESFLRRQLNGLSECEEAAEYREDVKCREDRESREKIKCRKNAEHRENEE